MIKRVLVVILLAIAAFIPLSNQAVEIEVGSKKFTESVILGETLRLLARNAGATSTHFRELGGSRILFEALREGEIDAYAEYTGTLFEELFVAHDLDSRAELRRALSEQGIRMSEPLGFNNTYGIGMLRSRARELGISTISDLVRHPDLRIGVSNEFLQRADGWPGLSDAYGLRSFRPAGLDHDIAYRQLAAGRIDAIDVYTTDARVKTLDLVVLEDDRGFFPQYDAVILYRRELEDRFPDVVAAWHRLEGSLSEKEMSSLNAQVEQAGGGEATVAADFLRNEFAIDAAVEPPTLAQRLWRRTREHLDLVRRSLLPAILVGIPLGILAARNRLLGHLLLGGTGVVQTIPALALLVLLIPLASWLGLGSVGTGSATAIIALFLYSLLPIVRNTHAGLTSIDPALGASAEVLNLPRWFRLLEIDLPLASRSILAGIKTAAVLNVGFATLGALIGAGGYGQPILAGIRLADTPLILEGALPAAALALAVQGFFEVMEVWCVPAGLRATSRFGT